MRIFIGLDICDTFKKEIVKVHEMVEETGAFIRWVNLANLHITCKFLGEINEEYIPKIEDLIFDVVRNVEPFEITLGELGAFPNIDMPRIIWVGIGQNQHKVELLSEKILKECSKLGFPDNDEVPFKAHITIGRVSYPKDKRALASVLRDFKLKPEICRIKAIKLFESEITAEGPIYSTIYEAPFIEDFAGESF
ncbi:MAG: RNA 2',3'-cyclic phosphodiesterase [Candidatus Omnitrophica bacterium]|nr:RNA 2',3'-cyclic phosphodiesterase [Candidatus Omnitrophota bacterium]